jgi:translocation and assembly module TamA
MTPEKRVYRQAMRNAWQQTSIVKTLLRRHMFSGTWRQCIAVFLALIHGAAFAQLTPPPDTVQLELQLDTADPVLETALRAQLNQRIRYHPDQMGDWLKERVAQQTSTAMESLGYLNSQIKVSLSADKPLVEIQVEPGPATRITAIELRILGQDDARSFVALPSRQQLHTDILDPLANSAALRQADVFTAQAWDKFKNEALAQVQKRAYLSASITKSEAVLDAATNTAQLRLEINTGPPVAISTIRLTGSKRYPESKVRELLGIRSGDLYDVQGLAKAQLALLDTRWFHSVTINTAADSQPDTVQLEVNVAERASQLLTLGVGYSTDLGARAKFSFEDNSIGPSAWAASTALTITNKKQSAELGLKTAPSAQGIVFGSRLRFDRQTISGESIDASSLELYRSKRGETIETVSSISFQRERQTIGGQTQERMRALVPAWSWNQRVLDDRVSPKKGFTVNAQLSGAARGVGSSTSFTRGYLRGLWLQPLGLQRDAPGLSIRGEIGGVTTRQVDLVPSENLFRAGGSQSIRGYGYQSLGKTQVAANGQSSAIVGVESLFTTSLELRVPFTKFSSTAPTPLDLAVFYDAGAVAPSFKQMSLVSGYGLGLRWRSIVGPINIDLAYAEQLRKVRLHFSVGFTF